MLELGDWLLGLCDVSEFGVSIHAASDTHNMLDGSGRAAKLPPELFEGLVSRVFEGEILPRVARIPTRRAAGELAIPAFNGDLRAYRSRESEAREPSREKLETVSLAPYPLDVLVFLTEELRNDAPAADAMVERAASIALRRALESEFIGGLGIGESAGVLNAAATITVAPEGGQGSATVIDKNLSSMFARLWGASIPNAAWFCSPGLLPELLGTSFYNPIGNTIFGLPVVPTEHNPAPGVAGDLALIDWTQYAIPERAVERRESLDVRFINHEQSLLFTWRVTGAPLWSKPTTPYSGSGDSVSPYVILGPRP